MSAPTEELSLDLVKNYMLQCGGSVNHQELVKHFKPYIKNPDPEITEAAKIKFKEIVNKLSTVKTLDDGKYLFLKKRYKEASQSDLNTSDDLTSQVLAQLDAGVGLPLHESIRKQSSHETVKKKSSYDEPVIKPPMHEPVIKHPELIPKQPPPYRPPPDPYVRSPEARTLLSEVNDNQIIHPVKNSDENEREPIPPVRGRRLSIQSDASTDSHLSSVHSSTVDDDVPAPPVPPRKKHHKTPEKDGEKHGESSKENSPIEDVSISVRERTQVFNKMASESDLKFMSEEQNNRRLSHQKNQDDDTNSVQSIEKYTSIQKSWIMNAAKADYQVLARMLKDYPYLAKHKDFVTGYTALHWACKLGSCDLVKLLAGTYNVNTNVRTNGGYTPLHLAAQFNRRSVFELLKNTYSADVDIRDYSGKKPQQYFAHMARSVSADSDKKREARFLRIGSLSAKVKRTADKTMGRNRISHPLGRGPAIHKTWGSADNVKDAADKMPPPKDNRIRKRITKRGKDFILSPRSHYKAISKPVITNANSNNKDGESDSDGACGFGNGWSGDSEM